MRSLPAWLLLACCATAGGAEAGLVPAGERAELLAYAAAAPAPDDFAVCSPGVVFVPVGGGLLIAGWNAWLVAPPATPIRSAGCDRAGHLYWIENQELYEVSGGVATGKRTVVAKLPRPGLRLVDAAGSGLWLWGALSDTEWGVLHFDPETGLTPVMRTPRKIGAVASAGPNAIVAALDGDLVLWQRNGAHRQLLHLDAPPDGVAVAADGGLFVSTARGVVRVAPAGAVTPVALGMHGALRAHGGALYVLWRDRGAVARLSGGALGPAEPRPAHATPTARATAAGAPGTAAYDASLAAALRVRPTSYAPAHWWAVVMAGLGVAATVIVPSVLASLPADHPRIGTLSF